VTSVRRNDEREDERVHDDGQRWDARYATITHVVAVAPEAIERWPELTSLLAQRGRCLDVACGPGGVTLWLADRGLDVIALDASGVAIDLLERAAGTAELADRVDARVVDLDDGLPDDVRDLDLIVCQRFHDPALLATMIERLRVGGVAIVTVLSQVGADRPGPYHAIPGELRATFTNEGCEILRDDEGDGVAHIVVRRC
jgi:SAM-dependent methyltransferase